MAKRKSKLPVIPMSISLIVGAVMVSMYDDLSLDIQLAIPWTLVIVFFTMWRLVSRKTIVSRKEKASPKVRRYIG